MASLKIQDSLHEVPSVHRQNRIMACVAEMKSHFRSMGLLNAHPCSWCYEFGGGAECKDIISRVVFFLVVEEHYMCMMNQALRGDVGSASYVSMRRLGSDHVVVQEIFWNVVRNDERR